MDLILGGVISVPFVQHPVAYRDVPAEELECIMNFDCNNDPKTPFLVDVSTGIMSLALRKFNSTM